MSLQEKHLMLEVPKLTDEQLLDIKAHGYNSEVYLDLVERTGTKYYRTFVLGRVADQLVDRGLMSAGAELEFWWEAWTGY